jgi:ankyrin repeat protein
MIRTFCWIVLVGLMMNPALILAAPIHEAVKAKDIATLKALLAADSAGNVNAKTKGDSTPLHWASTWNVPEAARLLIQAGADIEARTEMGATPLHWAAYRDSQGVADLLIRFGADINATSGKGYSPLHWAAIGDAPNVARLLLSQKIEVDLVSTDGGLTPLHCAIRKKARKILPVLIANGADLYLEAEDGSKPISWIRDSDYRAFVDETVSRVARAQRPVGVGQTTTAVVEQPPSIPTTVVPVARPPVTQVSGKRRLAFTDGSVYVGDCVGEIIHGKGTLTQVDGSRYVGEWENGRRHGVGIFKFVDGEMYEGHWVAGKRAGQGTYIYANGGVLEGVWRDDQFANGTGSYVFPDGDKYSGQWRDNKMWGIGTYETSDGKVFAGYWNANEFVAPRLDQ